MMTSATKQAEGTQDITSLHSEPSPIAGFPMAGFPLACPSTLPQKPTCYLHGKGWSRQARDGHLGSAVPQQQGLEAKSTLWSSTCSHSRGTGHGPASRGSGSLTDSSGQAKGNELKTAEHWVPMTVTGTSSPLISVTASLHVRPGAPQRLCCWTRKSPSV